VNTLVREYRDSDYAACRALYGEMTRYHAEIYEDPSIAGDDPGRGFDVYMNRADRCGLWVAEADGQVVGLARLLDTVGEEGVAEIEPVVVSIDYRREGVGSTLIKRVREEAVNKGFRFLSIRPELRNEKAFDLYVRLGFNKVGAIELFQDLSTTSDRKWKSGIIIHNRELSY
jgi:N-acetylglutamate synthase-like GNAT family acetyltransferase